MQTPLLYLKQDDATRGQGQQDPHSDQATEEKEHHPLVCRRCGAEISHLDAIFTIDSDNAVRVFPNPYGHLREIITLMRAQGLQIVGPPTTEFSWFAGFAWEVAYCANCGNHLGWQFTAVSDGAEPKLFYGLLRSELVES